MLYEFEFSGRCPKCDMEMEGFVNDIPRSERIVLFRCAICESTTAWIPSQKAAEGNAGKKNSLNRAFISTTPPSRCMDCVTDADPLDIRQEPSFTIWHSMEIIPDILGEKDGTIEFTARCWNCGTPSKIGGIFKRQFFFDLNRRMGFFMWAAVIAGVILSPLLLLLSPIIFLSWAAWRRIRGVCLRCNNPFTCYSGMPLLKEDGGGSLHKCPGCGSFYYIPVMGPVDVIRMTQEEVGKQWPDLEASQRMTN